LVEGLRSDLIAGDDGFWRLLPEHPRLSFDEAARAALLEEQRGLSPRSRLAEVVIRALSPTRDAAIHSSSSSSRLGAGLNELRGRLREPSARLPCLER
jgi:hypothetical protein